VIITTKVPIGVSGWSVVMVTADELPPLLGTTFAGEKRHVAPDGNPEHDSRTVLLNVPPRGVRLTENAREVPRGTVMLLVFAAIAKSTPVPVRNRFCGLLSADSLITSGTV